MTDPERIGSLAAPVLEILERRCKAAVGAKPRGTSCAICEDNGFVFVRQRQPGMSYSFFGILRCHCGQGWPGWYVVQEGGKPRRVLGRRQWDRQVTSYVDAGLKGDEVYAMSARLAYEEQEHQQRKAADDPAARAEREAIKEECDHD